MLQQEKFTVTTSKINLSPKPLLVRLIRLIAVHAILKAKEPLKLFSKPTITNTE